jgi:release factor glutamine methyltransferase
MNGIPIAYLTRSREFHGLDLEVEPAVLIPRPETEMLVDAVLERTSAEATVRILDLGTGSGAIAIAIAVNRPCAAIDAVDCSDAALAVAARNATRHRAANVTMRRSDWFDDLTDRRYDFIVSNPPYVRDDDAHLDQGDVRFEPRLALTAGADGLEAIRTIAAGALRHLHPDGWLMVEHGYDQGPACREIFTRCGLLSAHTRVDLAGHPRVCIGTAGQSDRR